MTSKRARQNKTMYNAIMHRELLFRTPCITISFFFCCCLFFLLEFYASHIQTYTQNAMAKTIEMMRYAAICLQFDIKSRTLADFHAYLHRLIYFIRQWMFWLLIWKQFENGWCIPLNPLCVFRYKHKFRFWKEIHKTFSIRNLQLKKKETSWLYLLRILYLCRISQFVKKQIKLNCKMSEFRTVYVENPITK